jgi:hypothetical protein
MRILTKTLFLTTLLIALALPISSNAFGYLNAGGTSGGNTGGSTGGSIGNTPPPGDQYNGQTLPEKQEVGSEVVGAVPEPTTWIMVGLGLAGIALASRSRLTTS